jgi:hypothetical protein
VLFLSQYRYGRPADAEGRQVRLRPERAQQRQAWRFEEGAGEGVGRKKKRRYTGHDRPRFHAGQGVHLLYQTRVRHFSAIFYLPANTGQTPNMSQHPGLVAIVYPNYFNSPHFRGLVSNCFTFMTGFDDTFMGSLGVKALRPEDLEWTSLRTKEGSVR